MSESPVIRFFGVVRRPQTWLGILFHWLAFPLGLFYFVFLITGLSLGVGLVVVWVGIPILLVVAGAWWLFAAFERLQARYLLGAGVPPAPREWEKVEGVWAKLRAHFGSGSTWRDLAYLLAKLPFGIVSFTLLVTLMGMVAWFFALPVFAILDEPMVNGTWVPPLWFGVLCVPIGVLTFFVALHVLNAWSWVCARWAELLFGLPATGAQTPGGVPVAPAATVPPAAQAPVVPQAPVAPQAPAVSQPPAVEQAAAVPQAPPAPPGAEPPVPPASDDTAS